MLAEPYVLQLKLLKTVTLGKYSNIIITDTVTNSFIVSASAFAHLQSMLPTAAG